MALFFRDRHSCASPLENTIVWVTLSGNPPCRGGSEESGTGPVKVPSVRSCFVLSLENQRTTILFENHPVARNQWPLLREISWKLKPLTPTHGIGKHLLVCKF